MLSLSSNRNNLVSGNKSQSTLNISEAWWRKSWQCSLEWWDQRTRSLFTIKSSQMLIYDQTYKLSYSLGTFVAFYLISRKEFFSLIHFPDNRMTYLLKVLPRLRRICNDTEVKLWTKYHRRAGAWDVRKYILIFNDILHTSWRKNEKWFPRKWKT